MGVVDKITKKVLGPVEKIIKKVLGLRTVNEDEDESYDNMEIKACIHTVCNCGREVLDDEINDKLRKILKIDQEEM